MIYSSSYVWASYKYDNPYKYATHQTIFLIMGFILMFFVLKIDIKLLKEKANIEEKITVELNKISEKEIKEIKEFKTVDDINYGNGILVIKYKKGKNNLGDLIDYFNSKKIKYNKIFSERPTLNDVFLELTGKELRD